MWNELVRAPPTVTGIVTQVCRTTNAGNGGEAASQRWRNVWVYDVLRNLQWPGAGYVWVSVVLSQMGFVPPLLQRDTFWKESSMMNFRFRTASFAVTVTLAAALTCFGQGNTGSINGEIQDPGGASHRRRQHHTD